MGHKEPTRLVPSAGRTGGWTLIELLAVIAVIAVLAATVLPAMVRHTDRLVREQESATLSSFANAFQQSVLASRRIPDQTSWYSIVATNMGISTTDVLYNVRQQAHSQQRVFLIDPNLQIGSGVSPALPYVQTNSISSTAGSPMLPVSPRVMIVSSLGKALPMSGGVFGTTGNNYFADLWNAADRTIPSDAAWTGWTGSPEDVIVQRINLAPLFVRLVLGNYNPGTGSQGYYNVDPLSGAAPSPVTYVDGYFIRSTVLALYNGPDATNLDTHLVLNQDSSFVFEQGVWRNTLLAPAGGGVGSTSDMLQQFLDATPNVNAQYPYTNLQQLMIVTNMLSYMTNYVAWYGTTPKPFDKKSPIYTTLQSLHDSLVLAMNGLYNTSPHPTNPVACP
jgi:prepilin-type N-terminal cleavage/methylation domain-containing protein